MTQTRAPDGRYVSNVLRRCLVCGFERVKTEGDEGGCPFCGCPPAGQRDRSEERGVDRGNYHIWRRSR